MDDLNAVMRALIVRDGPGKLGDETPVNIISDETLLAILLNRLRKRGTPSFQWAISHISLEMEKLELELKETAGEIKRKGTEERGRV